MDQLQDNDYLCRVGGGERERVEDEKRSLAISYFFFNLKETRINIQIC